MLDETKKKKKEGKKKKAPSALNANSLNPVLDACTFSLISLWHRLENALANNLLDVLRTASGIE
jgi:hypothetical protein